MRIAFSQKLIFWQLLIGLVLVGQACVRPLDGIALEEPLTGFAAVYADTFPLWSLQVHQADRQLYWINQSEGQIQRMDLDGGDPEWLPTDRRVLDFAMDEQNQLLYTIEVDWDAEEIAPLYLAVASLVDFSQLTFFETDPLVVAYVAMEYVPQGNELIFLLGALDLGVAVLLDLDTFLGEELAQYDPDEAILAEMAIDPTTNEWYRAEVGASDNRLYKGPLMEPETEELVTDSVFFNFLATQISIDPERDWVYFTESTGQQIFRIQRDGSNLEVWRELPFSVQSPRLIYYPAVDRLTGRVYFIFRNGSRWSIIRG